MRPKIDKILIPTDFSACANVALAQAAALAKLFDAELHVLHVLLSQKEELNSLIYKLPNRQELEHSQRKRCGDRLVELLGAIDTDGIETQTHLLRADAAAPAILEAVSQQGIDVIVMGTHGRRGFRQFLFGSETEEVVRSAPCPVLTVSEKATPLRENWPRRVTVPVDFSEHSRAALHAAKELLGRHPADTNAAIDLVYVVEQPVDLNPCNPLDGWTTADSLPQIVHTVKESLSKFNQETGGPEIPCEIEVLEGRTAESIAQHAEATGADLIVIATRGLTGVQRLLLGSVAEKVLRIASCPVLSLKGSSTGADVDA